MTFALFINRILWRLSGLFALFIAPICFISVPAIAIIDLLTFGFLLKVCNLIWIVLFLGPLLCLSRLWELVQLLRLPIAIIGVPLAALADSYIGVLPSLMPMWNYGSKIPDMLLCESWPFTWECLLFEMGKLPHCSNKFYNLKTVLSEYNRYGGRLRMKTQLNKQFENYLDNIELKPRFPEWFFRYLIGDIPNVVGTGIVFYFLCKVHWALAILAVIPASFLIGVITSRVFFPSLWKENKFEKTNDGHLIKLGE